MSDLTIEMQSRFEPMSNVVYAPLNMICEILQRPPEEVIIVIASLLTFLVCLPMPWIRDTTNRKAYSLAFGVMLGFYTYGVPYFLRIAYVLVGVIQLKFLPRQVSAVSVPVIAMILLTLRSLY